MAVSSSAAGVDADTDTDTDADTGEPRNGKDGRMDAGVATLLRSPLELMSRLLCLSLWVCSESPLFMSCLGRALLLVALVLVVRLLMVVFGVAVVVSGKKAGGSTGMPRCETFRDRFLLPRYKVDDPFSERGESGDDTRLATSATLLWTGPSFVSLFLLFPPSRWLLEGLASRIDVRHDDDVDADDFALARGGGGCGAVVFVLVVVDVAAAVASALLLLSSVLLLLLLLRC